MPTCPHCGHEADPGADACPLCGTPLDGDSPGSTRGSDRRSPGGGAARRSAAAGTARGEPVGADAAERTDRRPARPVPWEDPEFRFGAAAWRTWRESLLEPGRFFGRVRARGTVLRPLLYYLLVTVAASAATLVWEDRGLTLGQWVGYVQMGESTAAGPAVSLALVPVVALVAALTLTVVFHLGALMVAPERRGMGATARVVCYAAGPSLLAVVPLLGTAVGAVWSVVLQVIGLREVHRTTLPRAVFMIFWLWLALFTLALVLAVLAVGTGGGGGGGDVLVLRG